MRIEIGIFRSRAATADKTEHATERMEQQWPGGKANDMEEKELAVKNWLAHLRRHPMPEIVSSPDESLARLTEHIRSIAPQATEKQILKMLA